MKLPSLEEGIAMFAHAVQDLMKEIEECVELAIAKLKEVLGGLR